jgi:DNA invertase Pin-like site-specific DNA recombinase
MRAAVYVRCSTAGKRRVGEVSVFLQNPDTQVKPLLELLESRGWAVHNIYSDRMSGAQEARPGLQALLNDARRGLFGVVVVWRSDRFARSVKQLVLALEEFRSLGIEFISHQEALDTSTPMGKAMFTIIAAMAELERSVIRERVMAGLDYAREHGTKSGRAVGRPKRIFDRDQVLRLRARGLSLRSIARELGLGLGTVVRTLRGHPSPAASSDLSADLCRTAPPAPKHEGPNLEQHAELSSGFGNPRATRQPIPTVLA